MKKRLLALFLATTMALSAVGCGKETTPSDKEETIDVKNGKQEAKNEEATDAKNEKEEANKEDANENFQDYFPETIELTQGKVVRVKESGEKDGIKFDIAMDMYEDEETAYMSMNLNDLITFKTYADAEDYYAYVEYYGLMQLMMDQSDPEEIKASYAEEVGVDVSEVTEADIEEYLKSISVMTGYSPKEEEDSEVSNEEILDSSMEEFVNTDDIDTIFEAYSRDKLEFCSSTEDEITAKYDGESSDVFVTVNKNTKEISNIKFDYEVKPESISEDFEEEEPYFVQIEAELLPFEDIEIGWATKDAENTVEDVLSSYMSAIFMFALGQISEDDLNTIE